ncbi:MAG: DUF4214 domain-containing protein [Thalassovita sp.]
MTSAFSNDGTLSVFSLYDFSAVPEDVTGPRTRQIALSSDGSFAYAIIVGSSGVAVNDRGLQEINIGVGSTRSGTLGWNPQQRHAADRYTIASSPDVETYDMSANGGILAIAASNFVRPTVGHPIPSLYNNGIHVWQNGDWTSLTPHYNEPVETEYSGDYVQLWRQESILLGVADDGTTVAHYNVTYGDGSVYEDVDRLIARSPDGTIKDLDFSLPGNRAYDLSSDGRFALMGERNSYNSPNPLWRVDLATGATEALIRDGSYSGENSLSALGIGDYADPSLSDSGRFVLFTSAGHFDADDAGDDPSRTDSDPFVLDVVSGDIQKIDALGSANVAMSGDGRFIALTQRSLEYPDSGLKDIVVLDRFDGSQRIVSDGVVGRDHRGLISVVDMSLSRDGSVLVAQTDVDASLGLTRSQYDMRVLDLRARGDWTPILRQTDGSMALDGLPWSEVMTGAREQASTFDGAEGDDMILGDGFLPAYAPEIAAGIEALYVAAFGRSADAQGMANWGLQVLSEAADLQDIAAGLTGSVEFARGAGALSNADFVQNLFSVALGRNASSQTQAHFTGALEAGLSRADILASVVFSPEAEERSDGALSQWSEAYAQPQTQDWVGQVVRLYQTAFDRLPDAEGLRTWVTALSEGMALTDVAHALADSREGLSLVEGEQGDPVIQSLFHNGLGRAASLHEESTFSIGHLAPQRIDAGTILHIVAHSAEASEHLSGIDLTAVIRSLAPDDRLIAAEGQDTLFGGLWSDVFVFEAGSGGDHSVMDFEAWDQIDLTAFGYDDTASALAHFTATEEGVAFSDQFVNIIIEGVALSELTADTLLI